MQIIRKQKGGDRLRGLAYGKNKNWAPGQMCLVVVHGIGERGNETTELSKPDMWGAPDGGWFILQRLADKYGFNLIYTQSNTDNSVDEISYAVEQAVDDPDMQAHPDRVAVVGLSWGGRRLKYYAYKGFPGKYKPFCITRLAAGWVSADDWTNTIAHNIPTLLIHSEADAVVPETNSSTSFIEGRKKDPNAPIYYVELKDDPRYKDEHNITRVLSDAVIDPALVDHTYMVPKMSWLQWVLMNSWSERPIAITETYQEEPVEQPAPIPEPPITEPPIVVPPVEPPVEEPPVIPPVVPAMIKGYIISDDKRFPGSYYLEVEFTDGTKDKLASAKGDQIKDAFIPIREKDNEGNWNLVVGTSNERASVNFEKRKKKVVKNR